MSRSTPRRALISLLQATGRIRRQFGDVFGSEGIGESQYNILRILQGAGEPVAIMTIRDRMLNPQPSITRLIDRLVKRGLVRRTPCGSDRRRVECTITAAGIGVLDRLEGPMDARDREVMARLSSDDLEQLVALLERVGEQE